MILLRHTFTLLFILSFSDMVAQHSVARQWNEALLNAIRNDFARPTVHARNLWHSSIAMYDIWAAYDQTADTYLLGNEVDGFICELDGTLPSGDNAIEEAISYASYRLLSHRFANSPGKDVSLVVFDNLMDQLGYDKSYVDTNYKEGPPAALGNYLAGCLIDFGLQDGSQEQFDYANIHYEPVNGVMIPTEPGSQGLQYPDRWQPLGFDFFIDQSGFEVPGGIPDFLSAEWGSVSSFALSDEDLNVYERDGFEYHVYHDPGPPPSFDGTDAAQNEPYRWNHSLVAVWSGVNDASNSDMIDISPATVGGLIPEDFPKTFEEYKNFYNYTDGGGINKGYEVNPSTGNPYEPQLVNRGDYTRVLAEFWADGPDSETPPGHWFTILNYVNDHPLLEKKYKGEGEILSDLEWDIKSYFVLGGGVHDAAVAAWGVKGWYDFIRPISAIRYMADLGQSTFPELSNYHPGGLPIIEKKFEIVEETDPLAGAENEHIGKIKVYAWRGPEYIFDPEVDVAGAGWILVENWWPYQRPSFVTPPFAGYVSGHSTFSRAAAEIMALFTGNAYFPGGMAEFHASQNEFLVFEEGPTSDIVLQWAKYYDASDQCSLSRIWGGIHPPVDDIPGRKIGIEVGVDAFRLADSYFRGEIITALEKKISRVIDVYPNPVSSGKSLTVKLPETLRDGILLVKDMTGRIVLNQKLQSLNKRGSFNVSLPSLESGLYFITIVSDQQKFGSKFFVE